MSQIIKAFTGIFMVLFLMATSMGILGAFVQTLQVQNLHGQVIDELENSDYSIAVLEETFQIAKNHGVTLEVLLYLEDGSFMRCDSQSTVPASLGYVEMAEVAVSYPIQIPFVGLDKRHRLVGYAR